MCIDGSAQFIKRRAFGGNVAMVLSQQQVRILETMFNACEVTPADLRKALWPEIQTPFTAAQRASLSRSLRRLQVLTLIQRCNGGSMALTEVGREWADFVLNENRYWRVWAKGSR